MQILKKKKLETYIVGFKILICFTSKFASWDKIRLPDEIKQHMLRTIVRINNGNSTWWSLILENSTRWIFEIWITQRDLIVLFYKEKDI